MLTKYKVGKLYRFCEQCAHARNNFEVARKYKREAIQFINANLDVDESDYFDRDEAQMLRMYCHRCFTERFASDAETARDRFLEEAKSHVKK